MSSMSIRTATVTPSNQAETRAMFAIVPFDHVHYDYLKLFSSKPVNSLVQTNLHDCIAKLSKDLSEMAVKSSREGSLQVDFLRVLRSIVPDGVKVNLETVGKVHTVKYFTPESEQLQDSKLLGGIKGKAYPDGVIYIEASDGQKIILGILEIKAIDAKGRGADLDSLKQACAAVAGLELPSRLRAYGSLKDAVVLVLSPFSCFVAKMMVPDLLSTDGYRVLYHEFDFPTNSDSSNSNSDSSSRNKSSSKSKSNSSSNSTVSWENLAHIVLDFVVHSLSHHYDSPPTWNTECRLEVASRVFTGMTAIENFSDSLLGRNIPKVVEFRHPWLNSGLHHGLLLYCDKDQFKKIKAIVEEEIFFFHSLSEPEFCQGKNCVIKIVCNFYGLHSNALPSRVGGDSLLSLLVQLDSDPAPWKEYKQKSTIVEKYQLLESFKTYGQKLKEVLKRTLYEVRFLISSLYSLFLLLLAVVAGDRTESMGVVCRQVASRHARLRYMCGDHHRC
eukprot:GHVR01186167.1.p1 GENE.GHVR01186167.1~~GHVR01186167.1.p1  ORF type:complete len:500 (+),score=23.87 GHVR01186167.1:84-1583(+)